MSSKWDDRFVALAQHVAGWSKDPSTKVGAVLVDSRNVVVGMGYNGFPRYVSDDSARYEEKMVKYKLVVHSELNAILNAQGPVGGTTLYTTKFPCSECTKALIQAGVMTVHTPPPSLDDPWREDAEFSKQMMSEACVVVREYTP